MKEQLAIALEAAKARAEALDHVLLVGPPGLGKTTLAQIVRQELGVGLRTIAGPALERKADMAAILTSLEPRDVLFVDEIHRVNRAIEEILYPALEDFRMDIVVGQGPAARTLSLDLPQFTLVGATTRTGLLTTPLRDRFGMTFRLDLYEPGELGRDRAALGADPRRPDRGRGCRGDRPPLTGNAADREQDPPPRPRRGPGPARRARSRPRSRGRRWRCWRSTSSGSSGPTASSSAPSSSASTAVPSGLSTLAIALGEEQDTIEDVYEPYLLRLGFLQRTPRGRIVTERGPRPRRLGRRRRRGAALLR